jgi:hypothetical protein
MRRDVRRQKPDAIEIERTARGARDVEMTNVNRVECAPQPTLAAALAALTLPAALAALALAAAVAVLALAVLIL